MFSRQVGELAKSMLHLVVTSGTGKAAQVGDEYIWGKTGTTENYGDAWFVGGNDDLTIAVWVGYADKVQSMETEHAGSPVAGGTFPAEIFHDFMTSWLQMRDARRAARHRRGPDQAHVTTTTTPSTEQTHDPATAAADRAGPEGPRAGAGRRPAGNAAAGQPAAEPGARPPDAGRADPTPTPPPTRRRGSGGGVAPGSAAASLRR